MKEKSTNEILLSICIPTNGRIEIVKNTLDSIFMQAKDFSVFEVILSDNSKTDELLELLKQYSEFPNIKYEKTEVPGFMNSINALRMGSGKLLKLHNNYTELKEGSLDKILNIIANYQETKPVLFFCDTIFKNIQIKEYDSFDEFMYALSYFSTWSTGFSIWNADFQNCTSTKFNSMFPHTSLLFEQNKKNLYVINNENLFFNQNVSKKGGYNLFNTFAVVYLRMLEEIYNKNHISGKTFNHIKSDLYKHFLIDWYLNTKIQKNEYTFDLSGIKESMKVYYSLTGYVKMVVLAYIKFLKRPLLQFIKQLLKFFLNKKR